MGKVVNENQIYLGLFTLTILRFLDICGLKQNKAIFPFHRHLENAVISAKY